MNKVHPDKPHRIQLCPFGEFAKVHADGTTTVQVCDEQAFNLKRAVEPSRMKL
mgnify:CR=1 FL=1